MMVKRKGNALIIVMVIIAALMLFLTVVLDRINYAYKNTIRYENNYQVSLLVDSGIEKGLAVLKDKILSTSTILTNDTIPLACDEFVFYEGNLKCEVKISDTTMKDPNIPSDDTSYKAIEVKSVVLNKNEDIKTLKTKIAYILRKDINNEYYKKIFENVFSTLDDLNNPTESFNIGNKLSTMYIKGRMYLQGNKVNFFPKDFDSENGRIEVNANTLNYNNISGISDIILKRKTLAYLPATPKLNNNIENEKVLPILKIMDCGSKYTFFDIDSSEIHPYNPSIEGYPSQFNIKAIKITQKDPLTGADRINPSTGKPITKLICVKITKNSTYTGSPFPWSALIDYIKPFIMKNMQDNPHSEAEYANRYKLYLIDSDVTITQQSHYSAYINHIIYTPNSCYIKRGVNTWWSDYYLNSIVFANSSITGKTIKIDKMDDYTFSETGITAGIQLYSIGELNDSYPDFDSYDRASINEFLVNNLENYADALSFKVVKWVELGPTS